MIVHKPVIVFVLSLVLTGLSACSPRALHEAEEVVRTADSLRAEGKMYGIDEGDSATLAQAYETLKPFAHFPSSFCTSFTHACYHYGRLLREKDNPVAAMECFINASHTRTRDYHILGRVYSNMGSICHLAGEYQLAYDMYERSANCFLADKDTLSYCFLLNDMAFELAEQGEKEEAFKILFPIEEMCADEDLLSKIFETKADAYLNTQQYDSAIYFAKMLLSKEMTERTGLVIIAQAYSLSDTKDSAVYYARKVLACSEELFDINNALYILTNDDDGVDKESLLQVASERSDTQKIIENEKGVMAKAAQLLDLEISRKMNFQWLYAIIVTIIVTFVIIYAYRKHQRHKHSLLSQQIESLSNAYSDIQSNKIANIEQVCKTLRASSEFTNDLCWKEYNKMCKIADNHFYLLTTKLKQKQVLNEQEIRLCILVLIDYSNIQIAQILSYAVSGVGKFKYRVAKKLGIDSKNLRKYLLLMAIDEPFEP